jgi:Rieske Fe-S protein
MSEESQQDQHASRRVVLLGVGLAGVGGALAGCSTAAVPYDANGAGNAASPASASASGSASAPAAMGGGAPGTPASSPGAPGSTPAGVLLGSASEIPVGGGKAFTAAQVVVTQPAKGEYKAFSAVCTHVGCVCNAVANGTIDCPCHGSTFKITDGSVVTGPATAPLPPKKVTVADGKIMLMH